MSDNGTPPLLQDPRYVAFVKRYAFDLQKFAKEVCGVELTWQQVIVALSVIGVNSRTSISSGHGTGKTGLFGIISLWHLLCYKESVTAIVAPNITQVKKQVFKEIGLSLNRMKKGEFKWVADQVELLKTEVYVKGAQEYWHILAKTAPKGEPENLAGLHAENLLIIVDEASGVEDAHFGVLTGALTQANNRMVLASQPTRNVGFFYDTHHELSKVNGGEWESITLNSEESPLVTLEFLLGKKKQYSKEQYDIKVRGLFPNKSDGFLLGRSEIDAIFGYNPIDMEKDDWGYVVPIDVGGGDYRDESVMTVAIVCGFGNLGEDARRVYITDIPLCTDTMDTVVFSKAVHRSVNSLESATVPVDFGGMGVAFIHQLNHLGTANVEKVKWGNPCFLKDYKEQFLNLRAQAIVSLARAIQEGRFGISQSVKDRYGARIINELTRIPYFYDEKARYQIMAKKDMRAKGIPSPDIADTFAFTFMEGINYIAVESKTGGNELEEELSNEIDEDELDAFFKELDEVV